MKKAKPEPAFPSAAFYGMDLRDYFAGQALGGLLAAEANAQMSSARVELAKCTGEGVEAQVARECYDLAAAMLAERAK